MAVLRTNSCRPLRGVTWSRLASFALGLICFVASAAAAPGPAGTAPEYQLKAVFLFNFAQFVEWPAQAQPDPKTPLVIGVLGDDPFGAYLDDLVRGERIGDHPLVIRRSHRAEELTDCHIVFVCRSAAKDLDKILARLRGLSLLTVSDLDGFTRQGGMVRFAMENGKIRLRINVEAARVSDLKISSKILRPATIVAPGKD